MKAFPSELIRPDLRDFTGYSSARTSAPVTQTPAEIWLNANESGAANSADEQGSSRRYPDPQPADLVQAFAELCATSPDQIVVGRGSDEAIELLIRSLCRPGSQDGIVVCPPTFGMYAVGARLHGVPVIDVPQRDDGRQFTVDLDAVAAQARAHRARVVFLASPGNPTGSLIPLDQIATLADSLADQAVIVVDEAYGEFAAQPSAVGLLEHHPTVVVLRTLSKAHALAGARIGIALAHPELAAVMRRVQAPYPLSVPAVELALTALQPAALKATEDRVEQILRTRQEMVHWLGSQPGIRTVYTSEANFLTVRCDDPDSLLDSLAGAGVVVRDLRAQPGLADALRITIGTPDQMKTVHTILTGKRS